MGSRRHGQRGRGTCPWKRQKGREAENDKVKGLGVSGEYKDALPSLENLIRLCPASTP